MAVGEMITNIMGVYIKDIENIKCSVIGCGLIIRMSILQII